MRNLTKTTKRRQFSVFAGEMISENNDRKLRTEVKWSFFCSLCVCVLKALISSGMECVSLEFFRQQIGLLFAAAASILSLVILVTRSLLRFISGQHLSSSSILGRRLLLLVVHLTFSRTADDDSGGESITATTNRSRIHFGTKWRTLNSTSAIVICDVKMRNANSDQLNRKKRINFSCFACD